MIDAGLEFISQCWLILGQMAPYLLFGFLIAGVLSVCISPEWVERHLGRRGFAPILKASLFGIPLPLCSCGVIPVSASLRRHGASRAATTAFLLSTPQTGVDSIAVTYALLGPVFAIFRPISALFAGVLGGLLVLFFGEADEPKPPTEEQTEEAGNQPATNSCQETCCTKQPSSGLVRRVFSYGFITLPRDIGFALLIGVLLAGAMATLVPPNQLAMYVGGGVGSLLILMALGIPIYVCATASVPLAVGFLHMGASPGAALAFLIAGPATNAATLTTIWKVLGSRTTLLYLTTVALCAVLSGLALDGILPFVETIVPELKTHIHMADQGDWLGHLSACALLGVLLFSYRFGSGHKADRSASGDESNDNELTDGNKLADGSSNGTSQLEFRIVGMRCSHCVESVKRSLRECDRVVNVDLYLETGRAVVHGENLTLEPLTAVVTQLGYTVEQISPTMTD